jgi:hypothetical protein
MSATSSEMLQKTGVDSSSLQLQIAALEQEKAEIQASRQPTNLQEKMAKWMAIQGCNDKIQKLVASFALEKAKKAKTFKIENLPEYELRAAKFSEVETGLLPQIIKILHDP